jgi:hypothetical protein
MDPKSIDGQGLSIYEDKDYNVFLGRKSGETNTSIERLRLYHVTGESSCNCCKHITEIDQFCIAESPKGARLQVGGENQNVDYLVATIVPFKIRGWSNNEF